MYINHIPDNTQMGESWDEDHESIKVVQAELSGKVADAGLAYSSIV